MAKKQSKVAQVEIADEVKTSNKRENMKDFLKRKLATFGKFKQTSVLVLRKCWDPVRCTICGKIVFWAADISFQDEHTEKDYNIKNLCVDCCIENQIKAVLPDYLTEVAIAAGKKGLDKKMLGNPYSGICSVCWNNTNVFPYYTYLGDMPVKVCYCQECLPKKEEKYVPEPEHLTEAEALAELDDILKA